MRIVQFTDTHIIPNEGEVLHGVDSYLSLKKAFQDAMSLTPLPNLFLVSGDITEDGSVKSYKRFKRIFDDSNVPVYVVPGNHDDETKMKSVFENSIIHFKKNEIIDNWNFMFVNSRVPNKGYGRIRNSSLKEIENILADNPNRPTLVLLHHPPLSPCPSHGCKLENERPLLELLKKMSSTSIILSGHMHMEIARSEDNVSLLTAPSTFAYTNHPTPDQQDVDLDNFWKSHDLDIERQGYRVLDLDKSGKFETQVCWI